MHYNLFLVWEYSYEGFCYKEFYLYKFLAKIWLLQM